MSRSRIERGRPTYGVDVGIMLLDADFPRPPGDIAHGATFPFPVHYEVTGGAVVPHVVEEAAQGLLPAFVDSGRRLLARGARVLATSCGFLAIFQRRLAEELRVPVATSSLLQIPLVLRLLPADQRVCVITVNASTLTGAHWDGAGLTAEERARLTVVGLEHTDHFYPVVVGEEGPLEPGRARAEVVAAATRALEDDPAIAAFVFECTNLPPYAQAVREETGKPVWDAISLVHWMNHGAHHRFEE